MYSTGEYRTLTRQILTPADEVHCLRDIFRNQPVEHLAAGRSLFIEGDEAEHVFEVTDGVLRIFKIIADGRRIITGFLFAGNILGISIRNRYIYSAEAVSSATLRRVTLQAFRKSRRQQSNPATGNVCAGFRRNGCRPTTDGAAVMQKC